MHGRVVREVTATIGVQVERRLSVEHVQDRHVYRPAIADSVTAIQVGIEELLHAAVLPIGRLRGRGGWNEPRRGIAAGLHSGRAVRDWETGVRTRGIGQ